MATGSAQGTPADGSPPPPPPGGAGGGALMMPSRMAETSRWLAGSSCPGGAGAAPVGSSCAAETLAGVSAGSVMSPRARSLPACFE